MESLVTLVIFGIVLLIVLAIVAGGIIFYVRLARTKGQLDRALAEGRLADAWSQCKDGMENSIFDGGVEGTFPTFLDKLEEVYAAASMDVDLEPLRKLYKAMERNMDRNLDDEMQWNAEGKKKHKQLTRQVNEQLTLLSEPQKKKTRKRR